VQNKSGGKIIVEHKNITGLENETRMIGEKISHLFFNYYQIEDESRKKQLFYEILAFVKDLLMKNQPDYRRL
jgi:hypothetical protein